MHAFACKATAHTVKVWKVASGIESLKISGIEIWERLSVRTIMWKCVTESNFPTSKLQFFKVWEYLKFASVQTSDMLGPFPYPHPWARHPVKVYILWFVLHPSHVLHFGRGWLLSNLHSFANMSHVFLFLLISNLHILHHVALSADSPRAGAVRM